MTRVLHVDLTDMLLLLSPKIEIAKCKKQVREATGVSASIARRAGFPGATESVKYTAVCGLCVDNGHTIIFTEKCVYIYIYIYIYINKHHRNLSCNCIHPKEQKKKNFTARSHNVQVLECNHAIVLVFNIDGLHTESSSTG